jgi:hypothetical protein
MNTTSISAMHFTCTMHGSCSAYVACVQCMCACILNSAALRARVRRQTSVPSQSTARATRRVQTADARCPHWARTQAAIREVERDSRDHTTHRAAANALCQGMSVTRCVVPSTTNASTRAPNAIAARRTRSPGAHVTTGAMTCTALTTRAHSQLIG